MNLFCNLWNWEWYEYFVLTYGVCCLYKTSVICCTFFVSVYIYLFFFFRIVEPWLPPKRSTFFFLTSFAPFLGASVCVCVICGYLSRKPRLFNMIHQKHIKWNQAKKVDRNVYIFIVNIITFFHRFFYTPRSPRLLWLLANIIRFNDDETRLWGWLCQVNLCLPLHLNIGKLPHKVLCCNAMQW